MNILFFGEAAECQPAIDTVQGFLHMKEEPDSIRRVNSRDALRMQLAGWEPSLILVLADRSRGMEGVYAAKETRPEIPVFWFSDDEGFGMQSYRLECDYFAVKPVTEEKLKMAFHRCKHMGTPLTATE